MLAVILSKVACLTVVLKKCPDQFDVRQEPLYGARGASEREEMRRFNQSMVLAAVLALVMAGPASAQPADPMCDGMAATIVGTNGDDFLEGTEGADVIVARSGDDFVAGLGGDDVICGGNGDDELFGDSFESSLESPGGNDRIFGENGSDFVVGMQGADVLSGGNGEDVVIGGPANDQVNGDNGDDLLFGAFGNDTLNGGAGDDFLNGDLPFPADFSPAPPGAYLDPRPNSDNCDGSQGTDAATFCESESDIEEHPDPATVILDV